MMRKTADFRLVLATGALAALACGGVSEQDFFDTPTPKRAQTGGAGGMSSIGTGGFSGSGTAAGGTTATSGGSGGTAATGGTTSTGGSMSGGGSGSLAAGGTSSGDAGTGAGNAPSSGGTGGSGTGGAGNSSGGAGGSDAGATGGTGGSSAGTGGDAGSPMGGAGSGAGAGQGGMSMTGGAGAAAGGRGGRGGGPGMTCAERLEALAQKLDAAQTCSMAQDAGCDDFVEDECGCEVPVNRATSAETKDYLNAVKELGDCAECTRSSCEHYTRAYCRSSSGGGIMGRCQGVGLTTL